MNLYVMGSVLDCEGDGGFLGDGFASLEIGEGPVEGRSFLRTEVP
jgi:hypothetical protein